MAFNPNELNLKIVTKIKKMEFIRDIQHCHTT